MQSTNAGSSKLYQSQISINSFILFSYRVFFVSEFLLITWHLWTAGNKRKTMAIQHKSQAVIERTWYTGRWCQQTSWIWTLSWQLFSSVQFSSVQSLSCVWLFVTPWIAAWQASLSITNSKSLLKLMSIESMMPSNHLILCGPLLLLPPIPPSIRVFSNESTLCIRWPKYWSFSCSISPSSEHPGLIPFRWTGWISLQFKGPSRVFSNTTVQKHQFFS